MRENEVNLKETVGEARVRVGCGAPAIRVRARCFVVTLGLGLDMYDFREWNSLGTEPGSVRILARIHATRPASLPPSLGFTLHALPRLGWGQH